MMILICLYQATLEATFEATFEAQFMKKLNNTEAELKNSVAYKKKRVVHYE